jgi:hypothetical protein
MSVNVRWNGRGWSGKVPRSPVARPEVRIGKGIGIEKRPTERYRKSRMAKNGDEEIWKYINRERKKKD